MKFRDVGDGGEVLMALDVNIMLGVRETFFEIVMPSCSLFLLFLRGLGFRFEVSLPGFVLLYDRCYCCLTFVTLLFELSLSLMKLMLLHDNAAIVLRKVSQLETGGAMPACSLQFFTRCLAVGRLCSPERSRKPFVPKRS